VLLGLAEAPAQCYPGGAVRAMGFAPQKSHRIALWQPPLQPPSGETEGGLELVDDTQNLEPEPMIFRYVHKDVL